MQLLGGLFTQYRYERIDVDVVNKCDCKKISSLKSGFSFLINPEEADVVLPPGSPFENWTEARRFAGPLPFTFSFDMPSNQVLIVEGVRENWRPKPLMVSEYDIDFSDLGLEGKPLLASAFVVSGIPYSWKKGRREKWTG